MILRIARFLRLVFWQAGEKRWCPLLDFPSVSRCATRHRLMDFFAMAWTLTTHTPGALFIQRPRCFRPRCLRESRPTPPSVMLWSPTFSVLRSFLAWPRQPVAAFTEPVFILLE